MIVFLEDSYDFSWKEEVETGRWEVFRLKVNAEVLARLNEWVAMARSHEVVCYTTVMLDNPEFIGTGSYLFAFHQAPSEAALFKLTFECEHFERGVMPDQYQFDLRIDPVAPVQRLRIDPLKAHDLY